MTRRRLTRRTFLRGLGGTSIALPFLSAGLPGLARAEQDDEHRSNGQYPKRLIVFFHPNGVIPRFWWPNSTGDDPGEFELQGSLAPLEPFKDRLLFLKGINMESAGAGPGGPHQQGMGGVLTGRPLQEGEMVGNDGSMAGWGDGISIDQAIAEEIGESTPFKSLQLGVRGDAHGGSRVRTRLSYAGPGEPLAPQNDPRQVFEQLFSDIDTDSGAHDEISRRRASVLDTVQNQFDRLEQKVGKRDREKLERHLQKVRDLERRLQSSGGGEQCLVADEPGDRDPDNESTMPEIMQSQLDLAVMALTCDLTRVVSLQISNSVNHIRYPWLDSMGDGHALSHAGPSNTDAKQQWKQRDAWHAEQFAYLLDELDQIPEGDGTMLDNTLLLWVQEISKGNTHSHDDMPFVLAGNVDEQFRTGRVVDYQDDQSHNDLLATIGKAFGLESDTFGDERFSDGPLASIT